MLKQLTIEEIFKSSKLRIERENLIKLFKNHKKDNIIIQYSVIIKYREFYKEDIIKTKRYYDIILFNNNYSLSSLINYIYFTKVVEFKKLKVSGNIDSIVINNNKNHNRDKDYGYSFDDWMQEKLIIIKEYTDKIFIDISIETIEII